MRVVRCDGACVLVCVWRCVGVLDRLALIDGVCPSVCERRCVVVCVCVCFIVRVCRRQGPTSGVVSERVGLVIALKQVLSWFTESVLV